MFNYSNHVL